MQDFKKIAVIGAGVMGSTIAAHLANAGMDVLLLDIVPNELTEDEKKAGLTLDDKKVRNRFSQTGLDRAIKSKPAAFYLKEYARLIETGNLEDDISKIKDCDWVIEVVVENMDIKKKLFTEKIIPNYTPGTIVSTNTSGLSVNEMAEVMPDEMRKHFLVTHFFNPPRYMRLLEIVPTKWTLSEVVEKVANFSKQRLGKGIVYAKDTPNFVANRIGVFSIFNCFKIMTEMDMTIEEVDAVAGPPTARPKSAAFRTCDLVGIDTLVHVGKNSYELLKNDESREIFKIPDFVQKLVDEKHLGNKTGIGFYKKEKENGKKIIYYYDYKTGEYVKGTRPKFASVESVKMIDDPAKRIKTLISNKDKAALFAWRNLRDTLIYSYRRIPEIADDIVNIDNGMKWGFNWELGPFEIFDAIGVKHFCKRCEEENVELPEGLKEVEKFYKFENGKKYYWDIVGKEYKEVPMDKTVIDIQILKHQNREVEKNGDASIIDMGDGIFLIEFHSKMNSVGGGVLTMVNKAIDRAEREGIGLVIGNQGKTFSAGANLMLLATAIAEGAWDDINLMVKQFQKTSMRIKYSKIPVVAAPFHMVLGGGCEFCLHADAINALAETYMGLVEMGVGLIPAGGGTKELCLRAIEMAKLYNTDVQPFIVKYFMNIGTAKVSMSAAELYGMGYMRHGDSITMNPDNLLYDAKQKALALARNYRPDKPKVNLKAPGRDIAATIKSQLFNMKHGKFVTEYEEYMGQILAEVITGGDVPAGTLITEEYILDLEREAFLKLCGQKKTLERIQHMLLKGKPLRN